MAYVEIRTHYLDASSCFDLLTTFSTAQNIVAYVLKVIIVAVAAKSYIGPIYIFLLFFYTLDILRELIKNDFACLCLFDLAKLPVAHYHRIYPRGILAAFVCLYNCSFT